MVCSQWSTAQLDKLLLQYLEAQRNEAKLRRFSSQENSCCLKSLVAVDAKVFLPKKKKKKPLVQLVLLTAIGQLNTE